MNKRMQDEGGFTLIELLVTIAILGVLFGIVTLTLGGLSTNATVNSCNAELAVVQSAVDIYMAANLLPALVAGDQVSDAVIASTDTAWGDAYLRSMPTLGKYNVAADGEVTKGSAVVGGCP